MSRREAREEMFQWSVGDEKRDQFKWNLHTIPQKIPGGGKGTEDKHLRGPSSVMKRKVTVLNGEPSKNAKTNKSFGEKRKGNTS